MDFGIFLLALKLSSSAKILYEFFNFFKFIGKLCFNVRSKLSCIEVVIALYIDLFDHGKIKNFSWKVYKIIIRKINFSQLLAKYK